MMANNFVLGGLVAGQRSAEEASARRSQLGIQAKQLGQQQSQFEATQKSSMDTAAKTAHEKALLMLQEFQTKVTVDGVPLQALGAGVQGIKQAALELSHEYPKLALSVNKGLEALVNSVPGSAAASIGTATGTGAGAEAVGAAPGQLTAADILSGSPATTEGGRLESQRVAREGAVRDAERLENEGVRLDQSKQELAIKKAALSDPKSPQGKLAIDRLNFVGQFGEGSPQVAALDEVISAKEEPKLTDVGGMRKEFTSFAKEFVTVKDAFSRIQAVAQREGGEVLPAADLALMFNYMKMLDPASVVRESEFAQIAATGSFGERLKASAERFISGERLTPEMRMDFYGRAEDLFRAALGNHSKIETQFRELAGRSGFDPNDIVIDLVGKDLRQAAGLPEVGPPGSNFLGYDENGNALFQMPDGQTVMRAPQ